MSIARNRGRVSHLLSLGVPPALVTLRNASLDQHPCDGQALMQPASQVDGEI